MAFAGVVLAAGLGTRLRPLTNLLPKALCPVNNEALLDRALTQVGAYADDLAVNAHAHAEAIVGHVGDRAYVSVEPELLGTAGALGQLSAHLDGRDVLLANCDAWRTGDLGLLVAGWDGMRPRLLCADVGEAADFGDLRYAGACLLPWAAVRDLPAEPSGLYEQVWRPAYERAELDLVTTPETFIDCGTPAEYLRANLVASGGQSVVGPGAEVHGQLVRSVVWPGGYVGPDERLVDSIRAGRDVTVRASPVAR